MRIETPTATCAWDGAGIAKIPAARTKKKMKRAIRMFFTSLAFDGFPVSVQGGSWPLETTHYVKPGAMPKVASDVRKT